MLVLRPAWINPGRNLPECPRHKVNSSESLVKNTSSPYATPASTQNAADYVTRWVSGLKHHHNLTMEWVGLFNEGGGYTPDFIKTLRHTLDTHGHTSTSIVGADGNWEPISSDYMADAEIRTAIGALSQHYPHCDATMPVDASEDKIRGKPGVSYCAGANGNALAAHREYGVPLWSSEDYSCWTDSMGAQVWASEINSQYIGGNISMVSAASRLGILLDSILLERRFDLGQSALVGLLCSEPDDLEHCSHDSVHVPWDALSSARQRVGRAQWWWDIRQLFRQGAPQYRHRDSWSWHVRILPAQLQWRVSR